VLPGPQTPNSTVKLPAPLALLVGGPCGHLGLPVQPAQHRSAPQLTAGVKPLTGALMVTLLDHP